MLRFSKILLALFLLPPLAATPTVSAATTDTDLEASFEFTRAKLLAENGDFQGALEAFRRTIELDGDDPYALVEVARFHGELAQIARTRQQQITYLDEGLAYIEAAKQLQPDNPDVLRLFAETHLRLASERPASLPLAQGAYERLRVLDSGDLQVLMSLAQIYLWEKRPALAADVLQEAVGYSPRNRMIHSMLVDALYTSGQPEKAEGSLEALIRIEPDNLEVRMQLAELRSERGDHAGAIEVLEGAVAIDPEPTDRMGHGRLRSALAREYHLDGRHEDALRTIDALIADSRGVVQTNPAIPASPRASLRRLRAAILSAMTRYGDAAETFRPVVENGTDAERRAQDAQLLARLYERQGDDDLAVDLIRRELDRAPEAQRLDLRIALAGIEQRSGRLDEAARILRDGLAAIDTDTPGPGLVFAAQDLAEVLLEAERADEALATLGELADRLEAAPERPDGDGPDPADFAEALRLRRALIAVEAEDWPAVDRLADPLAASKDAGVRLAARQLEAQALAATGRLDEAVALLDPALLDEADADATTRRQLHAARLDLLFEHGEAEQARDELIDMTSDGEPEQLFFAAQVFQQREHYTDAIPLYERLIETDGDTPNLLFALGAAYERTGRHDEATVLFERLLDLRPGHAPTLNYLAYMWIEKAQNLDRALAMVHEAVAAEPDNGAYVDSLGWAYYQLGRFGEARTHLEWAARLEADDPTVFEHLGDVYLALDEPALAREALRRALVLATEQDDDRLEDLERKLDALDALDDEP